MSLKVSNKNMDRSQAYQARGIIAKMGVIGEMEIFAGFKTPIVKFMTLDAGQGEAPIAVEFIEPAPMIIGQDGETYLDIEQIAPGMIVIQPGLLYRKIPMFDTLMAKHLKALKTYKRKDIIEAEAPAEGEAIDLGWTNLSNEKITQKDHDNGNKILN